MYCQEWYCSFCGNLVDIEFLTEFHEDENKPHGGWGIYICDTYKKAREKGEES